MNAVASFRAAMQAAGLSFDGEIIGDGKIHRFTPDGDHGANGWYVLHLDGIPAGSYGSWKTGTSETWSAKSPDTMTPAERRDYQSRMAQIKAERALEEQKRHEEARAKAAELWAKATPANEHPYLIKKAVKAYSIRVLGGNLVIPVSGIDGDLRGLQTIDGNGGKFFLAGTEVKGAFYTIGEPTEKLVIAEGYATGASIHEVTGIPVAIAFNCGNLLPVAEALHEKYPNSQIIIAADDDFKTAGNPGLTLASEAARAVNGLLAVPIFPENRGDKDNDYNDLMKLSGPEAVRECIEGAKVVDGGIGDDEPLLFGEIQTPAIPCSLLPGYLGSFAEAVSETTQTPSGLAVMMTLSVLATALQKKFEVAPFGDEHREPLSLWTMTGMEPGTRKTAVKNELTRPLTLWEQTQADQLKAAVMANRHVREVAQKRIESLKNEAAKIKTEEADRKNYLNEVFEIETAMPEEITFPRLWADDTTPERLQGLLATNGERLGILSDEGGLFEVMAGLYSGGKFNVNVFLQGHAGSPVRVDRQGRSIMLDKPAVSFGMAVQPSVLSDLASGGKSKFRGNGLLARFLFCLPTSNVGKRTFGDHRRLPEQAKAAYYAGIDDMLNIPPIYDEQGREQARVLTLSPEARNSWVQFGQYVESRLGSAGDLHQVQDWASKLPGAAIRIAGLLHVAMYGEQTPTIGKETMERALDLSELLIAHAQGAFSLMGDDEGTSDAKAIFQWIVDQRLESFTQREAYKRHEGRVHRVDRLKKALQDLAGRNIISEPETIQTGRRPSIRYRVNPKIYGGGAL